jgi:hypothetical protein
MRQICNRHFGKVAFLVLLIAGLYRPAFAQETATITGTVTDPSGAAVPAATITVTNTATGVSRTVTSTQTGDYSIPDLNIGNYRLKADMTGFKTYERTGITLNVNATVRVDIPLQVGQAQETVTVEANAIQVQSDTSEQSNMITGQQIAQIDTNGRNPVQLATLVPGASGNIPDFNAPTALASSENISFNGERSAHNIWLVDGGENYDRGGGGGMITNPSPDAIAEFRVTTSNNSAQFGDASGGMISIALKSGSRDFHASAWEFNRNDAFDANNYFSNLSGTAKPELRYNAFGFNIGGPVFIPHHYNKDRQKTFFFYNMEWRRLIQGGQIYVNGLTANELSGNFSADAALKVPQTTDPAELTKYTQYHLTPGGTFPNNTIPTGLIDPNAAALIKAGIFPTANAAGNHYSAATPVPTNLREEIVRIDHQFNDKLSLMGDMIYDSSSQSYATTLWSGDTYPTVGTAMNAPSYSAVVRLTQSISASVVNETSFNYNGNQLIISPAGNYTQPSGFNVGTFFSNNKLNRNPSIYLQSPYGVNYDVYAWPWYNIYNNYDFKDDLALIRGNHSFKFGGEVMHLMKNQDIFGRTQGQYTFNGNATGNSLADFLLGFASSYDQTAIQDAEHTAANTFALYALDDWKVTPRLTLNLGIRWEGLPHAYDVDGRLSNFQPELYNFAKAAQFNADGQTLNTAGPGFQTVSGIKLSSIPFYLNGIALAGRNGTPMGLVQNYWDTFAPRIGFAYDLTGSGKTVIRSGFGMFYERTQGNDIYDMGSNPPFNYDPSVSNVYFSNPSINYTNGAKATAPTGPANLTTLAYSDYKIPTSMQYSFQIQQQLSAGSVFSVAYVGNHDYHQSDQRNINPVTLNNPNRLAICGSHCGYSGTVYNANLGRIYPGFGTITEVENASMANYNSLQLSYRLQMRTGLTIQAAYTYSHELDDVTGDLNTVSDPFDRNLDYASGDLDRRHVAIFSYVYDLPFFKNSKNAFLHSGLGGWELSGITLLETGTPLNITLSYDNLGLGGDYTSRPNRISTVTYPQTVAQWFSAGSFANPAALQFGNAGRNSVVGPGRANWNLALFKRFALPREGSAFEFRFETYNTFNHTQFNGVSTTFGNASFGQVNSTWDPRVLQLGAKLIF